MIPGLQHQPSPITSGWCISKTRDISLKTEIPQKQLVSLKLIIIEGNYIDLYPEEYGTKNFINRITQDIVEESLCLSSTNVRRIQKLDLIGKKRKSKTNKRKRKALKTHF